MDELTEDHRRTHRQAETMAAIQESLAEAWCAETSHEPVVWTPDNPAYKQCAVTAVLVQDLLGGTIDWVRARIEDPGQLDDFYEEGDGISHYFNRVDGQQLDFTRGQFPLKTTFERDPETRAKKLDGADGFRENILSNDSDRKRYELLEKRFVRPSTV